MLVEQPPGRASRGSVLFWLSLEAAKQQYPEELRGSQNLGKGGNILLTGLQVMLDWYFNMV